MSNMPRIEFEIKGRPIPWKRMRKNGKRHFPAAGQTEAKSAIASLCKAEMRKSGVSIAEKGVPVCMSVLAVFKLPQKIPKGDDRRMGSRHTMKPDGDNLGKLIKDALNGVAYLDDAQVSDLSLRKVWSDHERTAVLLEFLP